MSSRSSAFRYLANGFERAGTQHFVAAEFFHGPSISYRQQLLPELVIPLRIRVFRAEDLLRSVRRALGKRLGFLRFAFGAQTTR
jgi:hypothetical protein